MQEIKLSSGIIVQVAPVPGDLYQNVMARAIKAYPDPEIPKKEIDTVTGPETIDDTKNPEYVSDKLRAMNNRFNMVYDAVLDICVTVEIDQKLVAKYAKYTELEIPKDDVEMWYLKVLAIRCQDDKNDIVTSATTQATITEEDVRAIADFFRGDVEWATSIFNDASSPNEVKPVEV